MRMIDNLSKRKTCFVVADPRDNSISFSKSLAMRLKLLKRDETKVFVFNIPEWKEYGFIINADFSVQMGTVQYNTKYKTVGFESLNPTVNMIFYDYDLPHDVPVKLSVRVESGVIPGRQVFVIERPKV